MDFKITIKVENTATGKTVYEDWTFLVELAKQKIDDVEDTIRKVQEKYTLWAVEHGFLTPKEYSLRDIEAACDLAYKREKQFAQDAKEPTAEELTDEKIQQEITSDKYKELVEHRVAYSVEEGQLASKEAEEMSFKEKEEYLDWSTFAANSWLDRRQGK